MTKGPKDIIWQTDYLFGPIDLRHDKQDLQSELHWGAGRPESRWCISCGSQGALPSLDGDSGGDDDESVWERCLTTGEHKFYLRYLEKFPDSCYSLNQDPDQVPMYARGKALCYETQTVSIMISCSPVPLVISHLAFGHNQMFMLCVAVLLFNFVNLFSTPAPTPQHYVLYLVI